MAVDRDQLLLVAIELLRKQIADLPLAIGMNAVRATEPHKPSLSMSDLSYNADGSGGIALPPAPGTPGNPFNLPAAPRKPPPTAAERFGSAVKGIGQDLAERGFKGLSTASGAVVKQFGAMLGPMGLLASYATSTSSGFGLVNGAMSLFTNSVGQVFMPLMFTLSTGLLAASDVVNKKLAPAMDGFSKWVLSTGLPAMEQFANSVGKATDALKWLADSKLGKLAGAGPGTSGGVLGSLNRTVDRISGDAAEGAKSDGSALGTVKSVHRGIDDVLGLFGPSGSALAGSKNWLMKKTLGDAADPYSGPGVAKDPGTNADSEQARGARIKAQRDVLAEMRFQFAPRANITSATGNWSSAQMAALSMSPFQQRQLQLQLQQLAVAERTLAALEREEQVVRGTYTPGDFSDDEGAGGSF